MFWRFVTGSAALLAVIAVYCLARIYPPELLAPFQATNSIFTDQTGLFGSAPSFFYTLAVCLILGAFASTPKSARLHCSLWVGLTLILELSQHPVVRELVTTWLANTIPQTGFNLIGPYWSRGTFDQLDLVASIAGGLIALVLISYLPSRHEDAPS